MRHLLIATAALAVGGFVATAQAESVFYPGGPTKQNTMCQVNTDMSGDQKFGYWEPCPAQARASRAMARAAYDYAPAARSGAFYAGGPAKAGTLCQYNTDMSGDQKFGYWGPCAK